MIDKSEYGKKIYDIQSRRIGIKEFVYTIIPLLLTYLILQYFFRLPLHFVIIFVLPFILFSLPRIFSMAKTKTTVSLYENGLQSDFVGGFSFFLPWSEIKELWVKSHNHKEAVVFLPYDEEKFYKLFGYNAIEKTISEVEWNTPIAISTLNGHLPVLEVSSYQLKDMCNDALNNYRLNQDE